MKTVIVLERDSLLIKAFETIISKNNECELLTAVSAKEDLLQYCEIRIPDYAFITVTEDDIEFVERLHHLYPSISIYPMTFSNNFKFLKLLIQSGIRDHLSKPINMNKIKSILSSDSTSTNHLLLENLLAIYRTKRFDTIHEVIKSMSSYIVEQNSVNPSKLRFELDQMLNEAQELIGVNDPEKKQWYFQHYCFTDEILKEKYRIQFILFRLIDEIFRKQVIQRTPSLEMYFRYLEKNIKENISLQEAAESCGLSVSYLSRLLKERYNIGFNTYIQYRKMELAKQMFYFKDEKIIDVAFQLSYSEPSYFCKVFKRVELITPMNYKKEMEQEKKRLELSFQNEMQEKKL